MKKFNLPLGLTLIAMAFVSVLSACAPSATQLKKVMEDNPDIMFSVIEKNPDKFMKVVNEAAQKARQVEEQRFQEDEIKAREEEYKNPKKPVISDDRAIKGNKSAAITIIEYSDFQCPYCSRGYATMKKVLEEYPDKVKVIFKEAPIVRIHPNAMIAAQYYEAVAMKQPGKANEFHDYIFEHQQDLTEKGETFLKAAVKKLGLKITDKDVQSGEVKARIEADQKEFEKFGFSGTPGYLVNGISLKGAYPFDEFKKIIDRQAKGS